MTPRSRLRVLWAATVQTLLPITAITAIVGCAAGSSPGQRPTPSVRCPAVDTVAGRWIASVVIDGRVVGGQLPATREQELPEVFALSGPEPQALADLSPERIDLLQFVRGPDIESAYGLCPGEVAFVITIRPPTGP